MADPKYTKGDRVTSTVNHMPGMKGMSGVVEIVRTKPAYYGVKFDGEDDVHKWLAEDEVEEDDSENNDDMDGQSTSRKGSRHRPVEAVFADGKSKRPLALRPDAIGVAYPTRETRDRKTYELRAMVATDVADVVNGVAVLSIDGPLKHKSESEWYCYWQTYEDLARDFKLVIEDPSVSAVVLKFDSPGGDVAGLNETVAIMKGMNAASGKPVVGYVDESCYSAAYALAMVCDELYLPESGGVGSIGVITAMSDVTAMLKKEGVRVEVIASGTKKTDGHPCVPLTDGAIKRTRQQVDKLAASFFELVSAGRGLSVETVAGFQAGTFSGQAAVDAGLADGVMSLQECLTFATNEFSSSNGPTNRSADKEPDPMSAKLAAAKAAEDAKKIAAASAATPAGKVTKTKTVTTDTHEEEVDDGQPEEAEMPEPEPDGDEPEDENDDDNDAKASAMIVTFARELTGKKKASHVAAALKGMAAQTAHAASLQSRLDKLEADAKASKLSALISGGMKAGKLAPAQKAWALTQSPESLKAFLDAAPAMVRTVDTAATEPAELDALTPEEKAMCDNARPPVDHAAYAKSKAAIKARSGGKGV